MQMKQFEIFLAPRLQTHAQTDPSQGEVDSRSNIIHIRSLGSKSDSKLGVVELEYMILIDPV